MLMTMPWGPSLLDLRSTNSRSVFQIRSRRVSSRLLSDEVKFQHISPFMISWPRDFQRCRCFHFRERSRGDFIRLKRSSYCTCSSEFDTAVVANDTVVVANDEKYGLKPVISITPRLYDYILSNVREPEVLRELREETAGMKGSQMQVSPEQAQLLVMLVQTLGAQRCIEVGVFTGYSSLAIALVLPESGCLVACERDGRCLEIAKKYYDRAGVADKVDVRHGLAADSLKSMISNGEVCSYDFAFVDAEKKMNQEYFELLLQLVRVGGVIVIDNVLWHGKVADPLVDDAKTSSIRSFNKSLMQDERVSISMVPIGDGMTICRKR